MTYDPDLPPVFNAICIETLNRCTRSCGFCMFGTARYKGERWAGNRERAEMPFGRVRSILSQLRAIDYKGRISFYFINEPMMDRRIYDFYSLAKLMVPEAWLSIITNGDMLSQVSYARLIVSGLDEIMVSVYDDNTLAKFEALKNHAPFAERLVLKDRRENGWQNNRGAAVDYGNQETGNGCARPFTMLNVSTNGDARVCCSDMFGDTNMGNVFEKGIMPVWQGQYFRKFRKALAEGRRGIEFCRKCNYKGYGHKVRNSDANIPPPKVVEKVS